MSTCGESLVSITSLSIIDFALSFSIIASIILGLFILEGKLIPFSFAIALNWGILFFLRLSTVIGVVDNLTCSSGVFVTFTSCSMPKLSSSCGVTEVTILVSISFNSYFWFWVILETLTFLPASLFKPLFWLSKFSGKVKTFPTLDLSAFLPTSSWYFFLTTCSPGEANLLGSISWATSPTSAPLSCSPLILVVFPTGFPLSNVLSLEGSVLTILDKSVDALGSNW